MNDEIPRLRDDPEFIRETGCDLRDEAASLRKPDLAGLRARIVSATEPAPPKKFARWPLAGAATVAAALLVFTVVPDPPPAPPVQLAAAPPVAPPVEAAAEPVVTISPGREVRPILPRRDPGPQEKEPETGPVTVIVTVAEPLAEPVVEPPRTGDLAAQLAAFEAAEGALSDGDVDAARTRYLAYLERWPAGSFVPESQLGMLRVHMAAREYAQVESQAARLAADPAFAPRRAEISAVRADALVALGRCNEAREIAKELGPAERTRVARSCR